MSPRTAPYSEKFIEGMIHRIYRRMIEADDFGMRMHWWQRLHHYADRRPAGRR
jgi:hypothetical protein